VGLNLDSIKNTVGNIIAISFVALLFFFAFTWIIFDFNESATALKDSLSVVSSIFGGIATLAAAYIASLLVVNWKEQETVIFKRDLAHNIFKGMGDLFSLMAFSDKNTCEIRDLQSAFFKINQNLLIYSQLEPKIAKFMEEFSIVYIKQLGIFEKQKAGKASVKLSDNLKFVKEYKDLLHTCAKLININVSPEEINSLLDLVSISDKQYDNSLEKKQNELLDKVRTSASSRKQL